MSVLGRKLTRDLLRAKWQYVSVTLTVLLGVAFLIGSYAVHGNLRASYDQSYETYRFEDFGIGFHAAPERMQEQIRAIPGVVAVEGRLVEDVAVELEHRTTKKLFGRLISIPIGNEPAVNRLRILRGATIRSASAREVLLEASFADYHQLIPGSVISVVRGASRINLRVTGIVQSCEYLYVVRSKQDLIAMPDTFGVMFVSKEVLGPLLGKTGLIDEVKVRIRRSGDLDRIMRQAAAVLSAYEPNDPVSRADQPSSQVLEQDVQGFRVYGLLFPLLFLTVSAISVSTLLTRIVHQQRPVIGLLRSLGYTTPQVMRHYLMGSIWIGALGSGLGALLGAWIGIALSEFYMSQLQVPAIVLKVPPALAAIGILTGMSVCAISAIVPARFASGIRPAEAMRPLSPTFGRESLRLDALIPRLPLVWRIPLRNVFRQPRRTLSTIVGVVAGMCLIITASGLLDSMDVAIEGIMRGAFSYDLRADFARFASHSTVRRVREWPGVRSAEGALEVPVKMVHGHANYDGLVCGLEVGSRLRELRDETGRTIEIPEDGAVFGPTLRKRLGLEIGDVVELSLAEEVSAERSLPRRVRVVAFNEEAIGTQAYVSLGQAQRLFRRDLELPTNAVSCLMLQVEPQYTKRIRERVLRFEGVAAVTSMEEIRVMVQDLLKSVAPFVMIMQGFGAALALAMIFNMVTINVLERESEVATLRTIGLDSVQVGKLVVAENTLVTLIGILIGLPAGRAFVEYFWKAAQTEEQMDLMTFDVAVSTSTYLQAAGIVLLAGVLSQIPSLYRLARLNLTQATKERST